MKPCEVVRATVRVFVPAAALLSVAGAAALGGCASGRTPRSGTDAAAERQDASEALERRPGGESPSERLIPSALELERREGPLYR